MFVSFFPNPRPFFWSVALWTIAVVGYWYLAGEETGIALGILPSPSEPVNAASVSVFASRPFIWFYLYYAAAVAAFAAFWNFYAPHPWAGWSIFGSALIIFATYFQVQVSVAINAWYGPFYDLIQAALAKTAPVTLAQFFGHLAELRRNRLRRRRRRGHDALLRQPLHLPLAHRDERLLHGQLGKAAQDRGRFAAGTGRHHAVCANDGRAGGEPHRFGDDLIAFLPVLLQLSANVTEIPIIGPLPYALVVAAIVWSLFGTAFLALIGIKLPGLEFRNQRVEAAYRKELVYGEDDAARAQPQTTRELFLDVRQNYFRLYFHYMYFNIGRILYIQTDNIFPYIVLAPTIVAGKITLGVMNQILHAFGQVRNSMQFLVNSWTTIVELISIYKRLRAFEAAIKGEELPSIERLPERLAPETGSS